MSLRAVFFDEEPAAAVARGLREAGFEAAVRRERFAGEDDDEDHPWAVLTDAPAVLVEVLVEQHDGWLDDADPAAPGPAAAAADPPPLPDAPRRVKGHFRPH